MNKTTNYYPELDSLRFFAFLLVLVHHTPYYEIYPLWKTISQYGWMGVDLFLCLSAFLFTRLLFLEYQKELKINVGFFYLRRALRIWPLYFVFFGLVASMTAHESGWNSNMTIRSIGVLTFTDNIFSASIGYNVAILYVAHLWTISYEEQFYLVIPWVLRRFYAMRRQITFRILFVFLLVGMMIRYTLISLQVDHPAIWVLPITHFEAIIGGLMVGLGIFDQNVKKIPNWFILLGGILSLYLVTRLPNVHAIQWKLMLTYPLVGIGMTLILFAVMRGNLRPISSILKNKVLGYLGKISYGLYVYHLAVIEYSYSIIKNFIAEERLLVFPITVLIISFIVTTLVAMVSYQILEKPFLRLKEKFTFIKSRPI